MRLLLIDGTNVLMRCASVVVPGADSTATAEQVRKVVSLVDGLFERAAYDLEASHVIVCWDLPVGGSERKTLYPGYKASRSGKTAFWLAECRPGLGRWHGMSIPGWEADDVIATVTYRVVHSARMAKAVVLVLSQDSDLLQLASVAQVYRFGRDGEPWIVHMSTESVQAKYGVVPADITTLKALAGEPGDDVPGPFGKHCISRATKILRDVYSFDHGGDVDDILLEAQRLNLLTVRQYGDARQAYDVLRLRTDLDLPPIRPSQCTYTPRTK
jgi:DNA polymerase-1